MNTNIINAIILKILPYFIIGILLVFSLTVLIEINYINAEVEQLRTMIVELKKLNQ